MFQNEFLDKLTTDPDNYLSDLRRFGLGMDQIKLAGLLGLSHATIRRYESPHWNKNKVPQWYPMVLRFLSGDLSYFGNYWVNARIHPTDRKLQTNQFPHERMVPADMHARTNAIYRNAEQENKRLQAQLDRELKKNDILEINNLQLELENERLSKKLARLEAHEKGIEAGKVVNLFGSN